LKSTNIPISSNISLSDVTLNSTFHLCPWSLAHAPSYPSNLCAASKFVLHTVGPIVQGEVTEQNKADLRNSYLSCLELSKEISSIKSIAFCCISTGVFAYPPQQAAELAIETVTNWLTNNPDTLDLVVFNVFTPNDNIIYQNLLRL
jgi:O-acetyl-ADP-ribose deacetylase (regulator of RNase III)